jgi:hypothetical protein
MVVVLVDTDALDKDIDHAIDQARAAGWSMIPQVGHGTCDNALIRFTDGFTDIVTIPAIGHAIVVRLRGGPLPGRPRWTGHQWWRHQVPTSVAVEWALTDPQDDRLLVEWDKHITPEGHDE